MLKHTNQAFEAELEELKKRILSMGQRCEDLIERAVNAFEVIDPSMAEAVTESDRLINAEELAIDDLAVRILALRQPVGGDLRFLLTALKIVVDLERIGDEAVNIAERAIDQANIASENTYQHAGLKQMVSVAVQMLHQALEAYIDENADKAKDVLLKDDGVDELYGQVLRDSVALMKKDPTQVEAAMRIISCAKYLERIGDHSTNIAEMVVYMVRGVDVRHKGNR